MQDDIWWHLTWIIVTNCIADKHTVCRFYTFSMWNIDQICHPMAVLKYACRDNSKAPTKCLIWWSFGWDIWGKTVDIFQIFISSSYFSMSIISFNSSSNSKIRYRFEICLSWGFKNCHWILKLIKKSLRYSEVKGRAQIPKRRWKHESNF